MKTIMVVDDDKDLLLLLGFILKGNGYFVTTLDKEMAVIPAMNAALPDLLLLDINLGDNDGREICNTIRQNQAYDHVPVVLFSALVKEKEAMEGCKADAYIEKPIIRPLFLQTIASIISSASEKNVEQ